MCNGVWLCGFDVYGGVCVDLMGAVEHDCVGLMCLVEYVCLMCAVGHD